MNRKIEAARRQLGTALALYLSDHDPVSVHALAGGACELIEFHAEKAGGKPFVSHMLTTRPDLDIAKLHRIQRQYWNAFKHALDQKGHEREDDDLLAAFNDEQNDHALFIGWYDYAQAANQMPIEAQAHNVWYLAKYPEKLDPAVPTEKYEATFPKLALQSRAQQKVQLRARIAQARDDPSIMQDPQTDPRPLILPWL
ncbi:MAG: hypothetical protein NTV56_00970 [Alphaproteobacteria bacterium]|nr:hypothetical protein [Alphaproteobacteria bacterium]